MAGSKMAYNDGREAISPSDDGYVERPEVTTLISSISENYRGLYYLIAPRKSGKSSALLAIIDSVSVEKSAYLDFRLAYSSGDVDATTDEVMFALLRFIADELSAQCEVEIDVPQPPFRYPAKTVRDFFVRLGKELADRPMVLLFDELETIGKFLNGFDEFFEGMRAAYLPPDPLPFAIVTATLIHPSLIAKRMNRGDTMHGKAIKLVDFRPDPETVKSWAGELQVEDDESTALEVIRFTGGQPSVTNYLMHQVVKQGVRCSDLGALFNRECALIAEQDGLYEYFNTAEDVIAGMGDDRVTVIGKLSEIMMQPQLALAISYREQHFLEASGLVVFRDGYYRLRSPLVERLLNEGWMARIEKLLHLPAGTRKRGTMRALNSTQPRLLLINCGGTIGMERADDGAMRPPKDADLFLQAFPAVLRIADFPIIDQSVCKDGINIGPSDWPKIARIIYENRTNVDGVVVLHGTDSMAYTASAVAYQLGPYLDLPVVFTGAQLPSDVSHSDAENNFRRACVVASYNVRNEVTSGNAQRLAEVVIVYLDEVYRAVRAEKRDDFQMRGFHSPTGEVLAELTEPLIFKERLMRLPPAEPNNAWELQPDFSSKIFKIPFFPGLQPSVLDPMLENSDIEAFILQTPGVGNVPTEAHNSLIEFIEKAKSQDKPVIITHQIPISQAFSADYIPASAAYNAGAIKSGNMAEPAAITKVMWLLPQIKKKCEASDGMQSMTEMMQSRMETDYVLELAKDDAERTRLNQRKKARR